ncbi:hypothetical protein ACROYT_G035437 [Oculina patagonica]
MEHMLRKELHTCRKEKERLVKQVERLKVVLQIKADEVAELKAKLEAEVKGRREDQIYHEQELALASERASEQMAVLEKFKCEVELKLKDNHNMEQQKTDLEREVQSLIKENLSLKNSNEELNVQLVERHFDAGQQKSLADEVVTADDKEKLISTLREKEEENKRLRDHLDRLLKKIMEHNPELLQTGTSSSKFNF